MINPPPIETTEIEDLVAAMRSWQENYYYTLIYEYNKLAKELGKEEKRYMPADEFLEQVYEQQDWLKESRTAIHCGDCTAAATSCSRCATEYYYKLPSTVTWNGIHEGSKLLYEFLDRNKKD
jgi:succinate dehydrogenase/fumarate reductase-like Fe-S protein